MKHHTRVEGGTAGARSNPGIQDPLRSRVGLRARVVILIPLFLSSVLPGCVWGDSSTADGTDVLSEGTGRGERSRGAGLSLSAEMCEALGHDGGGVSVTAAPAVAELSLESLAGPEAREAVAAARAGLQRFLGVIPVDNPESFGFADRAEVERAHLAAPYRVWTSDAHASGIVATSEWRFPVTVDGTSRALLTVSQIDGEYRAVDFGAAVLARELGRLERDRSVAAGTRRVLLRLSALRADLASFPAASARVEEARFEPLASARAVHGGPRAAVEPKNLLPLVRERLKAMPSTP